MNTYTVTVKPNANAFAAILRFDPEAVIELEDSDETAETYSITSDSVLDSLLDAAPGLVEWDDLAARGYEVTAYEGGFKDREANEFIRAAGGEIRDYAIQNYDADDQPYIVHFVASAIRFDTRVEAEAFCNEFYALYVPESEYPVDPEAPHYYRNALHVMCIGEWSGE